MEWWFFCIKYWLKSVSPFIGQLTSKNRIALDRKIWLILLAGEELIRCVEKGTAVMLFSLEKIESDESNSDSISSPNVPWSSMKIQSHQINATEEVVWRQWRKREEKQLTNETSFRCDDKTFSVTSIYLLLLLPLLLHWLLATSTHKNLEEKVVRTW